MIAIYCFSVYSLSGYECCHQGTTTCTSPWMMWKHRVIYCQSIACTKVDDFHTCLIALTIPMLYNDVFQLHISSHLGTPRRLQRNQWENDAAVRNCGQNEVNNKFVPAR